jgi:hypothetical protein
MKGDRAVATWPFQYPSSFFQGTSISRSLQFSPLTLQSAVWPDCSIYSTMKSKFPSSVHMASDVRWMYDAPLTPVSCILAEVSNGRPTSLARIVWLSLDGTFHQINISKGDVLVPLKRLGDKFHEVGRSDPMHKQRAASLNLRLDCRLEVLFRQLS